MSVNMSPPSADSDAAQPARASVIVGQTSRKGQNNKVEAIVATVCFLFNFAACAGEAQPATSKSYDSCMSKSGGVTSAMLDCDAAEIALMDAKLNKTYQKLMSKFPERRKLSLKAAEQAWIKFRDLNCSAYLEPDGGSMQSLIL